MLGLEGQEVHQSSSGWSPVYVSDNLGVMSIGFMLTDPNEAVVWRGPRKNGLIKQFLKDVDWGTLDYLARLALVVRRACATTTPLTRSNAQIVDAPPGTSDEHISITQYLRDCGVDGAVIVTTPQEVALADVRKELSFCKKARGICALERACLQLVLRVSSGGIADPQVGLRVLGVVENMRGARSSSRAHPCRVPETGRLLRQAWRFPSRR